MQILNYCVPTRIVFGCGALGTLHELPALGSKALLVTSSGKSHMLNGSFDRLVGELDTMGVAYVHYNHISANPEKSAVEEGARIARENGCDHVIALGGGSVMDAAKCMAMLVAQDTDNVWEYAYSPAGGKKRPTQKGLPWIAITTSAGTGSEVDATSVVSNPEVDEKVAIPGCSFAAYAIVDPELMTTVPPMFTAYQGFDALFHCIEGYLSNKHNLWSEMVDRTAIENIGKYLARAVKDGNDLEAREGVAFANTLGGLSMVYSSTMSHHAMEHAMSAYHTALPHGAGLIMLSLSYFRFWIDKHIMDDRFIDMARFLGKYDANRPEDFLEALAQLQRDCGVDGLKMSDYGICKEDAMDLAINARATTKRLFVCDPMETTDEEIAGIYERAFR